MMPLLVRGEILISGLTFSGLAFSGLLSTSTVTEEDVEVGDSASDWSSLVSVASSARSLIVRVGGIDNVEKSSATEMRGTN